LLIVQHSTTFYSRGVFSRQSVLSLVSIVWTNDRFLPSGVCVGRGGDLLMSTFLLYTKWRAWYRTTFAATGVRRP